jgi:hypothetical protein
VTVGQAQVLVTALLIVATPWAVALAGHLKLLPFLVGLYWLGRRDWPNFRRFAIWSVVLAVAQLVLEPRGTVAYLSFPELSQVGNVNNFSVYAISPTIWAVVVAGGAVASLLLARTRWGWAAAIVFSVLATPRLLTYQLMSILAGLRGPDDGESRPEERTA